MIEIRVAEVTLSVVEPLIEPLAAVTVVVPVATLIAKPSVAIVAMLELAELQVAMAVRSLVVLSV